MPAADAALMDPMTDQNRFVNDVLNDGTGGKHDGIKTTSAVTHTLNTGNRYGLTFAGRLATVS